MKRRNYSQKPALFSPRLDSKQEEIKNEQMPGQPQDKIPNNIQTCQRGNAYSSMVSL